jgi:multiple sugar transport system substrate-binding protein
LEFASAHPDIIPKPLPVYTEVLSFEPYVLSLSTGSTALDAYLLDAPWVKRYSATNWLAPLTDLQDESVLEKIRPELLEVMSRYDSNGLVPLAVPFETKGNVLFYRSDLLKKYKFAPPETWGDLMLITREILEAENNPDLFGFLYHGQYLANDFYPIMWSHGGSIFNDSQELVLSQPANVRSLALLKLMSGSISPSPEDMLRLNITSDYRSIDFLFAEGKAVFMINWNSRWNDFDHGIEGQRLKMSQIGVAPLPREGDNPHYSNIGSFGWGVNYFSPNQRKSKQLIRFITSYESQVWRAINAGIVPARTDVMQDPELQRLAPDVVKMAEVFNRVTLKARPFQREINAILDDMLLQAILQDLDPLETLQEAEKLARESLDRFKKITRDNDSNVK